MRLRLASFAVALGSIVGCSSSSSPSQPADASVPLDASTPDAPTDAAPPWQPGATNPDAAAAVAARPYTFHVPAGYDMAHPKPTPLVVMFHGYGATGDVEETYMALKDASDGHGFLYAYGDGTLDKDGSRFWNATDGCCNFYGVQVDDVAYFGAIVDDVAAKYDVDPKRIFVVGHSNGGFMAHRLACEPGSRVAAIVSLAGATYADPSKCNPASPVSILEVHGDADQTILYAGGSTKSGMYPSAPTTVTTWGAKDGCKGTLAPTGQTLTVDSSSPPNATKVQAVGGCPTGIDVQLWTMQGSGHVPSLDTSPSWGDLVWGFLSAHPKP